MPLGHHLGHVCTGNETVDIHRRPGVQVTRPSRPARIVTNDQAGAALTSLGVRPVGIFSGTAPDQNPTLDGVNLAGIESVGEVYGEINVEKLAALAPELVVVPFDPRQEGRCTGSSLAPCRARWRRSPRSSRSTGSKTRST